ncbi:DUF6884 domain-containing protein [Knoellia locipacati]|nr:DUF6884 domain-containing protein [Knoellia locipacati]
MRFTMDGESFELSADVVRARLTGQVPEVVREYWVEIDGRRWPVKQVISLATGVSDRQRFQSQSARRWLQNLGFVINSEGNAGALVRVPRPVKAETPSNDVTDRAGRVADSVLVGCVKSKLGHGAPAKDLYTSDYFLKMRKYAEGAGRPWFILSAEHGLVRPDQWVEPYERYLPDFSRAERAMWGERVAQQLEEAAGSLADVVFDVHAGAAYVEAVRGAVVPRGAHVREPLAGLSFGRRLAWYLQRESQHSSRTSDVLAQLVDEKLARPLQDIVASGGSALRVPGMYSWWVDEPGAADLSRGLEHDIEPGLIYAGLAGATRSGGKPSSNTLWGRIATMHLGKKHEFSTLRRSLGSVLAKAHGRHTIDEEALTQWMHAHLRVNTVPVPDVTTLEQLEAEVLTQLDPPLNLAKVARTPRRAQLSLLRKTYGQER